MLLVRSSVGCAAPWRVRGVGSSAREVVQQPARLHVGARGGVVVAELDLVRDRLLQQLEQPARRHLLAARGAIR